jgi:hypothetical protein
MNTTCTDCHLFGDQPLPPGDDNPEPPLPQDGDDSDDDDDD